MTTTLILPFLADPADYSPEERTSTVAAILAAGLLRLARPVQSAENSPETRLHLVATRTKANTVS